MNKKDKVCEYLKNQKISYLVSLIISLMTKNDIDEFYKESVKED